MTAANTERAPIVLRAASACAIAGALCLSPFTGKAAAQFETPGKTATVTVEYEYISKGKRQDKYDTNEWDVRRYAEVTGSVVAKKPAPGPAMFTPDAAAQKDAQDRIAAGTRVQKKMQPTMQDMMAIAERCGDDEACLEREVRAYADGNADALNETRKDVAPDAAIATKDMATRYQFWEPTGKQTGRYEIRETQNFVDADPICQAHPNKRCKTSVTRTGGGPLALPPGMKKTDRNAAGASMFEVDSKTNKLMINLPAPFMPLSAAAIVVTDHPEKQNSEREEFIPLPPSGLVKPITVSVMGSSLAQSGELKIDVKGAQKNPRTLEPSTIEDGVLTIRWRISPN